MYQSPIRLAGFTGIPADKKELQLARKKMLAELELNGGSTLLMNGKELSRHDINTLFDELSDDRKREMHEAIFQRPALLHFLETGEINEADSLIYNKLNPVFRHFFSPLVGQAIHAFLQHTLRGEPKGTYYNAIQSLADDLLPADADFAFQSAFRYYTLRSRMLEDILVNVKAQVPVAPEDGIDWMSENRVALLNALPDSFSDLRYQIARDLNNISVALENRRNFKLAYVIIQKAALIETTSELMKLIQDNLVIHQRKAEEEARQKLYPRNADIQSDKRRNIYQEKELPKGNLIAYLSRKPLTKSMLVFLGILLVFFVFIMKKAHNDREQAVSEIAKHTYPMDFFQQHNDSAFIALKEALITPPGLKQGGFKDSDFIRINVPTDTIRDCFEEVWNSLLMNPEKVPQDTLGTAEMVFINHLPGMDMFALVNVDNRMFSALYIRSGQRGSLRYKGKNEASFNFYIGSNWDKEAWHEVIIKKPVGQPDVAWLIKGSFLNTPKNLRTSLAPEWGVFSRTEIERQAFRDTIEAKLDENKDVIFMLGTL